MGLWGPERFFSVVRTHNKTTHFPDEPYLYVFLQIFKKSYCSDETFEDNIKIASASGVSKAARKEIALYYKRETYDVRGEKI